MRYLTRAKISADGRYHERDMITVNAFLNAVNENASVENACQDQKNRHLDYQICCHSGPHVSNNLPK